MSKNEHYIYVSNKALNFNHFVIDLPTTIHLEGDWKCALVECSIRFFKKDTTHTPKEIYLLCDFCGTSFINNTQLPVLRKINVLKKVFLFFEPISLIYIPVKQEWVNKLSFSLCDENLRELSLDENTQIQFTIHLKKAII